MASSLRRLAEQVAQHLEKSGHRAATFVENAGISCRVGCADCCVGAPVECTPLELLPLAFDLVDEGLAESVLGVLSERAARGRNSLQEGCVFLVHRSFAPDGRVQGRCGRYARRPLVCIQFGSSVRLGAKGKKEVVACRVMKSDNPQRVAAAQEWVANQVEGAADVPSISENTLALVGLSPSLGGLAFPFDRSLQIAIEKALHAAAYETDVDA